MKVGEAVVSRLPRKKSLALHEENHTQEGSGSDVPVSWDCRESAVARKRQLTCETTFIVKRGKGDYISFHNSCYPEGKKECLYFSFYPGESFGGKTSENQ